MKNPAPVLEILDYRAHFHTRRGIVKAVDGVTFQIGRGETVGLVGESGSGKSVCQMSYLRLLPEPPLKIVGGEVRFQGTNLLDVGRRAIRQVRGNRIGIIFQEPMTALNPYLKIGTQVIEPLQIHQKLSRRAAWAEAVRALERVGIPDVEHAMRAFPHEFSGGMRQRVMIAMALTTKPDLLIADEPTTALDVTVQAQVLQLLRDLQAETGMAILFITHDLGVVASLASKVVVLYAGRVMEEGPVDTIFAKPRHPYTQALLQSTPRLDADIQRLPAIGGTPPDLLHPPPGCPFEPRCAHRFTPCAGAFPAGHTAGSQRTFCHLEEAGR